MKFEKKLGATAVLIGTLALGSSAFAGVVDYWEFTNFDTTWKNGGILYTDDAYSVNSKERVTIKFWQSTGVNDALAKIQYGVVEDVWYGWKLHGDTETFTLNNNGSTLESHTFYDIPEGDDYHIRMVAKTARRMNGGGNVNIP
ncbi:hypothetical protein [Brevibacillus massiliensis]|uniref:hypothetical protein n=1 Tax=Brevibacillus massiliensis TaxID=1118054 RepID=UPI00038121CB|nr:hypothetical protein [Brevibacillus massiliensis]